MVTKKKKKAVHVRHVLQELMANYQQFDQNPLLQICDSWEKVVGSVVNQDSRPAAYKNGVLWVHVSSSPWIHQLQFLKTDIMNKMNAAVGHKAVSEIKFKIGPLQ